MSMLSPSSIKSDFLSMNFYLFGSKFNELNPVYSCIGSGMRPSVIIGRSVGKLGEPGSVVSTRLVSGKLVSISPELPVIPPEVSTRVVVKLPSVLKDIPVSPLTDVPISPEVPKSPVVPMSLPNVSIPNSLAAGSPDVVIRRIVVFLVIVLVPPPPAPSSGESTTLVPVVRVFVLLLSDERLLLLVDSETLEIPSDATPLPSTVIDPPTALLTFEIK